MVELVFAIEGRFIAIAEIVTMLTVHGLAVTYAAITDRRKLVPGPRPEEQSVTDNRELTIDEIDTVSGGRFEFNFLGSATIWGDKVMGCEVWGISFRHGGSESGYKCPAQ